MNSTVFHVPFCLLHSNHQACPCCQNKHQASLEWARSNVRFALACAERKAANISSNIPLLGFFVLPETPTNGANEWKRRWVFCIAQTGKAVTWLWLRLLGAASPALSSSSAQAVIPVAWLHQLPASASCLPSGHLSASLGWKLSE